MLPLTLQVEIQGKFKPENKRTLTGAETWTVKEKKKSLFWKTYILQVCISEHSVKFIIFQSQANFMTFLQ